jgi:2-polyprenyl-3-methyl-5-hydroxy-6-metoxy-1,4-benzoquinol methylase
MRLVLERARLGRCVDCGHARTVTAPTRRTHEAYARDPGARADYEQVYLPARERAWSRGLALLGPSAHGAKLLDIGCNYGHFLAQAQAAGWDAYGVEASARARDLALESVASRIRPELGDVRDAAPFDAVTAWDVLEHVEAPAELLRELLELTSPGGQILVRVPDARAFQAFGRTRSQLYLALCHPTNPEEHPHHYTPESLAIVARTAGLRVRTVVAASDDERVSSGWSGPDRWLRSRLHAGAAGTPYEFVAILEREA